MQWVVLGDFVILWSDEQYNTPCVSIYGFAIHMIMNQQKHFSNIDELPANYHVVSAHKYGFFLCTGGTARLMLGSNTYEISGDYLCFYAPNTFFQILDKSNDLRGILVEDSVEFFLPVLSEIDIRKRLEVRLAPCVRLSPEQAGEIVRLYLMLRDVELSPCASQNDLVNTLREGCVRYLRYGLCLKVLEAYFDNTPVEAMPQTKGDDILNRFLVSLYDNCVKERTVKYYANEQHLSPYYFSSIVRERSGKSVLQWIGEVTMTYCRQYLDSTDMSVKQIADLMSFADQSTFGRYFKHHEGCAPSEYRARRHPEVLSQQ